MTTAQSAKKLSTAQALPGNGAIIWIEEMLNECITGDRKKPFADRNTEWTLAHKQEALLFFEQVTGKEVEPAHGYKATAGYSPDGLLINGNAVVVVKCPAKSEDHSPLLRIKSDNRAWLKSKIKGERQAWLKANRYGHYIECQVGMMCTGAKKCYYVSYDLRSTNPCHRMAVIELLPDEKMQGNIAKRNFK
jgi:hypothetical protein